MVNKGKYVPPWTRQKELQKQYAEEEVPDIDELDEIISNIRFGKQNPGKQTLQARALVALYYLTACRASEITTCIKLRKQAVRKNSFIDKHGKKQVTYDLDKDNNVVIDKWTEKHNYLGVKSNHIVFREIDGKPCMLIRTENRKNKSRATKRQPIPMQIEKPIVKHLIMYMKPLFDNEILFKFGNKRATQIINETTGFNIHFIRHIRATHLVTKYNFNEQTLIKFMGWTDARPAKYYMELTSQDMFRQFYKR